MSHSIGVQPRGEGQPRYRRHVLVEDQTGRPHRATLEKRRRRSMGLNRMACRFEQELKRVQDPWVIVHNRHDTMLIIGHRLCLRGDPNTTATAAANRARWSDRAGFS